MFNFPSMSVARRLGLLVASAVLGIIILASVFLISERTLIMQERQSGVRQTVEIAHGLLVGYHAQVVAGKLSEPEAKQRALDEIRALRYSGDEYFWINDMQPKMVMHPVRPELEGKDLTDNKDPTGKHLFVEFVNTVKASGAGFVPYMWPKPGQADPVQKVSYVKGFAPWGWIIGSGVYVDTVDAAVISRAIDFGIGILVLIGVLLAIGVLISKGILKQLGCEPDYAAEITQRIAEGDLAVAIALKHPEHASLLGAIASLRDKFAVIVSEVRQGSESVATASAEIAQGNHDLSARTESQASALEETAASMEQLSATVKQNADSARQANQLALNASTVAAQGGAVVAQVVDTMKGINDSSRRIADIIGVIDGIAFQTNILALNAAVEAARAGEQGRGFAVVASEVRSLAGRSAEAAKEIKTLINASVEQVEQGTALVDKAGSTMTEVVSSIRRVTDIMGEISAASSEQSLGVSQVGEAVTQMDQATQQNAALVEEMAAAASSLQSQAQDLVQVVAVFKLGVAESAGMTRTSVAAVRSHPPKAGNFQGVDRRMLGVPKGAAARGHSPAPGRQAPLRPVTPAPVATPKSAAQTTGKEGDWESF
ncbi:MAG: methyl-accepting chemotaxis protein [Rhodoferax sp.]